MCVPGLRSKSHPFPSMSVFRLPFRLIFHLSGYIILAFSGDQSWAELLRKPYVLGGPQMRGQNQRWLHPPCILMGPKVGGTDM